MAQAFVFKLGSLDLSDYVRVGPDAGMDPYGQGWLDPQFSDGPYAEGQPLVNIDAKNREQTWPLFLKATTKDTLNALKVQINREVANTRPLMVEWRDSGSSLSTFYDVGFARLDETFRYRLSEHEYSDCGLKVWSQPPYGHTGTSRIVGTAVASSCALSIPIASLTGDVPALTRYELVPTSLVSATALLVVAAHESASYQAYWPAASYGMTGGGGEATLIADTSVPGGKYLSVRRIGVDGNYHVGRIDSNIPSVFSGANRLLAVCRTTGTAGWALSRTAPGNGPTGVATSGRWAALDLGVFALDLDSNPAPGNFALIDTGGQGTIAASRSDFLHIAGFVVLPEDSTVAVVAPPYSSAQKADAILDGLLDKSYRGATAGQQMDNARRGRIPDLPPDAQMVTVLSVPMPGASSAQAPMLGAQQSAVVRARERFTFAR